VRYDYIGVILSERNIAGVGILESELGNFMFAGVVEHLTLGGADSCYFWELEVEIAREILGEYIN